MIEPAHPRLSIGAQCRLLSIARSTSYYEPLGESALNLDLMLQIDRQFMETPFYGVQQMTWHLQNEGCRVNVKRVRRLMRLMGLMPIYQKPNTSLAAKGYKTYPYLLRGLHIDRPNQVWCTDITYLPMRRGFLYLVAIMDWATRKVLAWRISNTDEAEFCVEAFNEAVHRFGAPEIMNSDHEQRSWQPVHVVRLDRPHETRRRQDLDGRPGPLHRQHLHRAPLAIPEIRVRVSARLGDRVAGQGRHRSVDDLLQPPAAPRCPWGATASSGLLEQTSTRPTGPESSLIYTGNCPANGEQLREHG